MEYKYRLTNHLVLTGVSINDVQMFKVAIASNCQLKSTD